MKPWTAAFVEQAEADLSVVQVIIAQPQRSQQGRSTVAMLLQMIFEKLAKAVLARNGTRPQPTHRAVSYLRAQLSRSRSKVDQQYLADFKRHWDLLRALEDANPAVAKLLQQSPQHEAPQLEYPWLDASDPRGVTTPDQSLPVAARLFSPRSRELAQLANLARALCKKLREDA